MNTHTFLSLVFLAINIAISGTIVYFGVRLYFMNKDASKKYSDLLADEKMYRRLLKTQGVLITSVIAKMGIKDALETLLDAGYQVSPDDSSDTKYTLYDPDGGEMTLEFMRDE